MMRKPGEGTVLLLLVAGFTLWGLAFVQLYTFQAIGCRLGWDGIGLASAFTLQRAVLVLSFIAWLAAHLALWHWLRGRRSAGEPKGDTLHRAAADLAVAAFGAAVFCFFAVFWLSPCL
ncbi:MAG: hypothetical protein KF765_05615 [Parvibaculaceae bacterium]|nr:hypothetical protein [Parvibaculaceae bacterium]